MIRDDLSDAFHEDPDVADELRLLTKAGRARKAGRTFLPSVHARPLPGAPGVAVRAEADDEPEAIR
jgi:hypothetical protein